MKMPDWIQKILRREPVKPSTPSLSVRENFLEFLKKPTTEGFQRPSTASGRLRPLCTVFE